MQYLVTNLLLLLFGVIWSIIGICINKKFYNNVKKEDHQERGKVIQRIMKTYSLVQCFVWPLVMTFSWTLHLIKIVLYNTVSPILIRHCITTLRFLFTIFRIYIGFNSLIIALCRYSFIVYETQVYKLGFKRIRYLYLSCSIAIPLLVGFLNEVSVPIETPWACLFMPEDDQTLEDHDNLGLFCTQDTYANVTQSPLYEVLHRHIPQVVINGIHLLCQILILIIYSNVLEGLMYLHTFLHSIR